MSRLSDFHASGVNFPDMPRLDVDELVGTIFWADYKNPAQVAVY